MLEVGPQRHRGGLAQVEMTPRWSGSMTNRADEIAQPADDDGGGGPVEVDPGQLCVVLEGGGAWRVASGSATQS
ncbi:MAG: hypothetical protein OEW29_11070 [Acidimicrobiia bacterium]|nr:hypothetical protein [Acidimicrobiia bacterium]